MPERGDALEAVLLVVGLAFLATAVTTLALCLLQHAARYPLRWALDVLCSTAAIMLICLLLLLVAAPIVLAVLGGGRRAGGRGEASPSDLELARLGAGWRGMR